MFVAYNLQQNWMYMYIRLSFEFQIFNKHSRREAAINVYMYQIITIVLHNLISDALTHFQIPNYIALLPPKYEWEKLSTYYMK